MTTMTTAPLPVAGFDCETTGTDVAADRIISAALVRRSGGEPAATRTWLIDPGIAIPAEAAAIHGITTADVRAHGAPPPQALDEIAQSLAECLAQSLPVLIYNAPFDLRILAAELSRHGLPTLEHRLGRAVKPVLDPLVIDKGVDRYRKGSRRLPDLMRVYGVAPAAHLHDAADDVLNTIAVFDALMHTHRELPTDPDRLHDWQVAKHREWATHYNAWLSSKGRAPTADVVWP